MRSFVPEYELETPGSLAALVAKLAAEPGAWKLLAGGTDVMVLYEAGQLPHKRFLNIWGCPELKGVRATADALEIGALATYTEVQRHPVVQAEFPSLVRAGAETGGVAIQNRGTVGGNLANASPAADTPPALACYDAELELVSAKGARRVSLDGFFVGYKKTLLREDEVIRAVRIARQPAWTSHYYRKVGTRKAQAISKIVLCGAARKDASGAVTALRLAMGSVAPTTVRLKNVEAAFAGKKLSAALLGQVRGLVAKDIAPIDDVRSTAAYRLEVAQNLVEDYLASLV